MSTAIHVQRMKSVVLILVLQFLQGSAVPCMENQSEARVLLDRAQVLIDQEKHADAVKLLRHPSLAENPEALYRQAEIFSMSGEDLEGIKPDTKQAREYYQKAAEFGHVEAAFALGQSYYFDQDTPENQAQAIRWWRMAAANGHADAAFELADLFLNTPAPEKLQEAVKLLVPLTHKEDHADKAHFLLGRIYRKGPTGTPDHAKSVEHLRKAVDLGQRSAKVELAFCYAKGLGVEKDLNRALALLEEANKGFDLLDDKIAIVKIELAFCYAKGLGVEKDMNRAVALFDEANKNPGLLDHDQIATVRKALEGKSTDTGPRELPLAPDADLAKRLTGKWQIEKRFPGGSLTGEMQYKAEGRFLGTATLITEGKRSEVTLEGTWRIEDGSLLCEVTKSTDQNIIHAGKRTRDTIMALDDKQFRYRDEDGAVFEELRQIDK